MSRYKLKALAAALPLQRFYMEVQEVFMHRCLQLAAHGSGYVAPNPLVGAVLVHEGRIIGEGWHQQYGQAHAEVNCLETVRAEDKALIPDSTMYVSLEPCAHVGKTPPCAHRLVAEGIKKVVIGTRDPFEKVNGKGIEILRSAGLDVISGVLEKECRWQNRRFFTFHEKQRPYIHLKWAQTADGFMAAGQQNRLKITGPVADRLVHKMRSEEAAIMIGTQTALLDNPLLTNRLWRGSQPIRVVIDRNFALPDAAHLLNDGGKTLVLNARQDDKNGHVQYKKLAGLENRDPSLVLQALYEEGIQSVLVEGGPTLLNSFIDAGFWDEAHIFTNLGLLAGEGLKAPAVPGGSLKDCLQFGNDKMEWLIHN